ncbi:MAG: (d)CMP kinase [Acidobacteriota bacterium]
MSNPLIVTLDGPAGVGKTSLARKVAQALGIAYLDTGAMFRVTALKLGQGSWDLPGPELAARLAAMSFGLEGVGEKSLLSCDGMPVGDEVRTEQVGMWASRLAARSEIRDFQKAAQRAMGAHTPLVAEGRDMGSVVFPEARRKFFLDADPRVRAERRVEQLRAMGQSADLEAIEASIRQRDDLDRNRAIAPLAPAPDAIIVDTSKLDMEQVFTCIMGEIGGAAHAS